MAVLAGASGWNSNVGFRASIMAAAIIDVMASEESLNCQ